MIDFNIISHSVEDSEEWMIQVFGLDALGVQVPGESTTETQKIPVPGESTTAVAKSNEIFKEISLQIQRKKKCEMLQVLGGGDRRRRLSSNDSLLDRRSSASLDRRSSASGEKKKEEEEEEEKEEKEEEEERAAGVASDSQKRKSRFRKLNRKRNLNSCGSAKLYQPFGLFFLSRLHTQQLMKNLYLHEVEFSENRLLVAGQNLYQIFSGDVTQDGKCSTVDVNSAGTAG